MTEEGNNPFTKAALSLTDNDAVGGLNALIARATGRAVITPYIALENIQKILAQHFIFLPKHSLDDGDQGNLIFHLDQFGSVVGQTDDGEFNLNPESGLYFYFEYSLNENGFYEIFSEIVDEEDLEEILQDYDGDDAEEDMEEIPTSTADLEYAYNTNQEEHSGMTFSEEIMSTGERSSNTPQGPSFRGRSPVKNAQFNYGPNGQIDSYVERQNRSTGDITSSREVVQKNPMDTYTSSTRATTNPKEPDVYRNMSSNQTSSVNIVREGACDTTKRVVEALLEATYKGKDVSLNKPFRTPGGNKKSAVYVDPDGDGKAKIVRFGDPNLSIKKDQPSRKKSYCARSSGQGNLTNKGSANYWSRKAWDC